MGDANRPTRRPGATCRCSRGVDATAMAIALAVIALLVIAGDGRAPATDAGPPPAGGGAHGAAGSGRNGFGGSIAPSPSMRSWPGTGSDGNGGPFSFIGAHYGSMWQVPASANNSLGVGYCVMEDVAGQGTVSLQPDPAVWDIGEMARAGALMASFGGDRVLPYGIDASGRYDVTSGEWQQPSLFGGGEYTRRRHVAVNFGVKMFVDDVSPNGAVAGLKLARDTAVVNGSGGEFSALGNGYVMAQRLARVAEVQHAVGGVRLDVTWATPDGAAPTAPGTYALTVRAADSTGKPVGYVPVIVLSDIGIDGARTVGAAATVDRSGDSADDTARWNAAESVGWPTMEMAGRLALDPRFALGTNPLGADVTDASGSAHFDIVIPDNGWELAFHTQAPTADVSLYSGTGVQGQITWTAHPQSASVHVARTPPPSPPPPPPPPQAPAPAQRVGAIAIRKVLDAADVQGARDMSGFEFDVHAANGQPIGRLTTGVDGRTPTIDTTGGNYTVAETAGPSWADGLIDGGPITFAFDPENASGNTVEVAYTNAVPTASITTAASDASDGDHVVDLVLGEAVIVDRVSYTALVPGSRYVVSGELMVRTATEMVGTGNVASTTFVPGAANGTVDVVFTVPGDSPLLGRVVVVYQQLSVAASARVVAVHADPAATEQTIRFAEPAPTTTPVTTPTTTPTTSPTSTTTSMPVTTTTTTTAPIAAAPPVDRTLPRTGGDGSLPIAAAGLVILLTGLVLVLATARARPHHHPSRNRQSSAAGRDRH